MKKIYLSSILFFVFIFNSLLSNIDVGQRFILTLPANIKRHYLKKWLEKTRPAGIMLLYHSNERQKIKKLISFLQREAKKIGLPKLFIAIDWEGGVVSRVNENSGFHSVPSPLNLARAERTHSFLAGKLIGQQCRDIGINMNFAPVLDVFDDKNLVLASRPFSKNINKIIEHSFAFASGLYDEGVLPVFKHFPGLGLGIDDTHFESVKINTEKNEFDKHVYPFIESLKRDNPVIMATHASFPKIFGNQPTTLSKKAVNFIKNINKNTLLITDDFWMSGVRKGRSLQDAVLKSFNAGYHLITLSPRNGEDIELISNLQKIIDGLSKSEKEKFKHSVDFINKFKLKNLTSKKTDFILNESEISKLLAEKTIKEFYSNLDLNNNNILLSIDLPKLRPNEDWFIKRNESYLAKTLKNNKIGLNEFIFNANNNDLSFLDEIINSVSKKTNLIIQTFFYGRGLWNEFQKQMLNKLKFIQKNIIIISLGHPYEKNILPNAKVFNLGSFSRPMLNEVTKRLIAKRVPKTDFSIKQLLRQLKGKRIGLLCHNASRFVLNNKEYFLPDFLKKRVDLKAIFSPEHGLLGNNDAAAMVASQNISRWGCPVYSLYGKYKKPTKKMLKGLDLLVVDLHDVGIRAFTYLNSLDLVMKTAKENNLPVLVIDHINPIYFWSAQGPILNKDYKSFVGMVNVPFIHSSTIGKIAMFINKDIQADLRVLQTLPRSYFSSYLKYNKFFDPSPNLPSLESINSYPITVFIEGTNYSEGRGTKFPFQQIGAPWVNANSLAKNLNSKKLPGVYFEAVNFKPIAIVGKATNPKHKNKICGGVFLHFYDLKKVQPIKTAKILLKTLFDKFPEKSIKIQYSGKYFLDHLIGGDSLENGFI